MSCTGLISRWNYSMSHQRVLMLLCTVILLPLSIAVSYSGAESGEGSLDLSQDIVSKSDHQETYIMPYWNMWSSDFFGWMEELRAQGAYDTLVDLARTYWAHFPLTSYLGYGLHPEQSEDTNN
ncbi:otospiralin-like [Silurus meridionalis]|uniref:otospiralin-like n=1 Tax=Silurus meridionalis TaxID=175797 RepID=UPI001EEA1E98|nr:otospiralin-like [Silurus meridionalis]